MVERVQQKLGKPTDIYQLTRRRSVGRGYRRRLTFERLETRSLLAILTVTSSGDNGGSGQLRQMIAQANLDAANGTPDTIEFDVSNSDLSVNQAYGPLELSGVGPTMTTITIDGTNFGGNNISIGGKFLTTVFVVDTNVHAVLTNLHITNGGDGSKNGGDILNSGVLEISNSEVFDGNAVEGGGIYNSGGASLTLVGTSVGDGTSPNNASNNGGGIYNAANATLNIDSASFVNANTAGGNGGGIYNQGTATVDDSTIEHLNTANGLGGGVFNDSNAAMTIQNDSLVQNNSANNGAGIYNNLNATLNINSNTSILGNAASGYGGGIYNQGAAIVDDSLIETTNVATVAGGGVFNDSNATMTVRDGSIVQGNLCIPQVGTGDGGGFFNNTNGTLIVSDSTLKSNSAGDTGGALYNLGNATVSSSTVTTNSANNGAGIYNGTNATLTVNSGTSIIKNTATDNGGGIYNDGSATVSGSLTFIGSVGDSNSALYGAGVFNGPTATFTINSSAIIDKNTATDSGGGVYNQGTVTVDDANIESNTAQNGGGIYNDTHGSATVLDNAVLNANSSDPSAGNGNGGGIFNNINATLNVSDVTLEANFAGAAGGALFNVGSATVSGCTITLGNANDGADFFNYSTGNLTVNGSTVSSVFAIEGGGMDNQGVASVSNSTFSGNLSQNGGGFYNDTGGTLTVTNSTTSNNANSNADSGNGGGFFNNVNATLNVIGTTVDTNGKALQYGGGIYNLGAATVSNSTFSANSAHYGGGLFNAANATMVVNGATISNNIGTAAGANGGAGGGLFNDGNATLTITGSTVTGNSAVASGTNGGNGGGFYDNGSLSMVGSSLALNTAAQDGGGIFVANGATATISSSTISNNYVGTSTITGFGGGLINFGTITVSSSTLSGNSTSTPAGVGGGLYNYGVATVGDSTFAGNSAGWAAGLYNDVSLTVSSCTISGNNASQYGGGIFIESTSTGPTLLLSTIVAGNTAATAGPDVDGAVQSTSSNNLIGNDTALSGMSNVTNQVGATPRNPELSWLADNGAQNPTMSLQSSSSAINAGGALTTLGSTIGTSDTLITVQNAAAIASTPGNYVIQIDNEQMLVTNVNVSAGTLTVQRGYNGTAMAGHNSGEAVIFAFDERGLPRFGSPDIGSFEYQAVAPPSLSPLFTNYTASVAQGGGTLIYSTTPLDTDLNASANDELQLIVANGTLTVPTGTGVAVVAGSSGSSSVVLQGSPSQLNTALVGLAVTPSGSGNSSLSITPINPTSGPNNTPAIGAITTIPISPQSPSALAGNITLTNAQLVDDSTLDPDSTPTTDGWYEIAVNFTTQNLPANAAFRISYTVNGVIQYSGEFTAATTGPQYLPYYVVNTGTNYVTVVIDPDHSVAETTYADNSYSFTFNGVAPPSNAFESYSYAQIRAAYGVDSIPGFGASTADGSGQVIAIVDPTNDPNIFNDVDAFDQAMTVSMSSTQTVYQQYGPASSFLTVYSQDGTNISAEIANSGVGEVPPLNEYGSGAQGEITMDVEWAHAIAPGAKIDLVESLVDLTGEGAVANSIPDVSVVSNSWNSDGDYGQTTETSDDQSIFSTPNNHLGITYLFSSGDGGEPGGYPSYSPNVVSVGATALTLTNNNNAYGGETGWSFAAPNRTLNANSSSYSQTGSWNAQSGGYSGTYDTTAANSNGSATWATTISASDQGWANITEVSATWVPNPNNATNATYSIYDATTGTLLGTKVVDQTQAPQGTADGNSQFEELGDYILTTGDTLKVVLNSSSSGSVVADAIGITDAWATGGGASQYESRPNYQKPYQSTNFRETPDVSFDGAGGSGVTVYFTPSDPPNPNGTGGLGYNYNGTSLSCPCWAGLIAIADQERFATTATTLNNPSDPQQTLDALYSLPTSDFHDVTVGYNGLSAGVGYDEVTGRGTPIANTLVPDLAAFALPPVMTVSEGGTYNGSPQPANATVNGYTSLEGVFPTFTYYAGSTATGTPLSGAPVNAGTYTVVASFQGSADYPAAQSSPFTFSISQATSTTTVADAGGTYKGMPFPATSANATGVGGLNNTTLADFTFSYVGTGSTTYGPSSTAPTNAGTYTVTATYLGDLNHLSSSSSPVPFTVSKASSSTTVADTGGTYSGSPFPATSADAAGIAGLNDTTLTDFAFSYVGTGSTTYGPTATAPVSVGTYTVMATYNGDVNHASSSSAAVSFTIGKAGSTTTVADAGGTYSGSPFSATSVDATGAGGLSDTSLADFTFSYSGTGSTTYGPSSNAPANVGTYRVTATYNGDANHASSVSGAVAFTIVKASSTPTVVDAGGTYDGSPFPVTSASAIGSGGLNDTTLADFTFSYVGTGSTTYGPTVNAPANAGTYTVTATYNGDTNHSNSVSNAVPFVINQASSTTTVVDAGGTYNGSPFPVTSASVIGSGGLNDTTLTDFAFSYVGTGSTTYGPTANAPLNAGTYTVTATYNGDANYASSSSVAVPFTVGMAGSSTTVADTGGTYRGSPFPATSADATGVAGLNDTTLTDFAFSYVGAGSTTYGPTANAPVNAGTYTVTATYNGDANHASSSSAAIPFTVGMAGSSTTVVDAGGTYSGSPFQATAASANGAGGLSDTSLSDFTFLYVGTSSTTYGPSANPPTNVGTYTVTATYNGDTDHTSSVSSAVPFAISQASSTTTVVDAGGTYNGSAFPATAASATGAGGLNDTTLTDFSFSFVGTGSTTYGPTANAPANVGAYTVTATYNGDANHTSSVSSAVPFTISQASSTTTVVDAGGTYNGSSFPVTSASATGAGGLNDTMLTDFTFSYVGTGSTNYGPTANAPANVGTYTVTATYNGDANNTSSVSSAVPFTIGQASSTTTVVDAGGTYDGTPFPVTSADATGVVGLNDTTLTDFAFSYVGIGSTTYGPTVDTPVNAGTYTVTAAYNGDANHASSSSVAVPFTVGRAGSSTTVVDAGGTYTGSPFSATSASATGAGGLNDTMLTDFTFSYVGTGSTNYGPTANAPADVGTYTVTATYNGDTNHTNSDSNAVPFVISQASSTTTVVDAGGTYNGSAFPATAASATGAGGLNDTTLTDFTFLYVGTGSTTFGPTATAPMNAGTYSVTATYNGDANHASSSSAAVPFTVSKAGSSTTAADIGGTYSDSPFPATSADAAGVAGLNDTTLTDFTFSYVGTGSTTFGPTATAPLNAGTYTVTATYNGDANHASSSSVTVPFTVGKAGSISTTVDAGGTYSGSLFPATAASATGAGGLNDTSLSDFTFSYVGTGLTTYGPSANPPTNVGTYTVTATYNGDTDHTSSVSSAVPFAISQASSTTTVVDAGGTYNESPFPVTSASAIGAGGLDDTTLTDFTFLYVGTGSTTYGPSASAPATAGRYMVTASFDGSADYVGGTGIATFTISPAAPTVNVTDNSGSYTGMPDVATATVAGVGSQSAPMTSLEGVTPTLTYYSGSTATGTALGDAPTAAGTYTVVATFAGSSDYTSGTASATFTINETAPPTNITLSNSNVLENISGAIIGTLAAPDPDTANAIAYTVSDNRFQIVGNSLELKPGQSLSHANGAQVSINVTATDTGTPTASLSKSFTIVVDANPHPWQNPVNPLDVNGDGHVSPIDALIIINELNDPVVSNQNLLPTVMPYSATPTYFDTNGDGYVSPVDALLVINYINANGPSVVAANNLTASAEPTLAQPSTNAPFASPAFQTLPGTTSTLQPAVPSPLVTSPTSSASNHGAATVIQTLVPTLTPVSTSLSPVLSQSNPARKLELPSVSPWDDTIDEIAPDVFGALRIRSKGY